MTAQIDAALVAQRALDQVGTPFRLFGRCPRVALDCAGLVLCALGEKKPDIRYNLKGEYLHTVCAYMAQYGWRERQVSAAFHDGDVVIVTCGPRQQHLMIRAADGWVHAHAGLGKVVHTPGESPWPVIASWRMTGE
jgi:murein DD-endopeptidase / murein LD-carboxypeptidase